MIKTKQGTIGQIFTWVFAFAIIVPLLIGLVAFSVSLAGKRSLSTLEGENEINFEDGFYQGELKEILETQVEVEGKFMSVKELILLWNFDKDKYENVLEENVKNVLTWFEYEYTDSNMRNLRRRGFAIDIYLPGKELPEKNIGSVNFNPGFCIGAPCKKLEILPVVVSDSEKINVVLLGSQEAVK